MDIQQEMLDHVGRRAKEQGVDNIVPNCADAHELPFADGSFDAAYLVTALGEIPDPARTLAELRRVLKPFGRLVVGEFFDRHQIRPSSLISLVGLTCQYTNRGVLVQGSEITINLTTTRHLMAGGRQ
ncbi:class I SAM-dependent methyltransferase [Amycolatopsis rhizosphaerae]|uniref:class I SAM-dependent methyltransferase n=1 Tax=Amycolatopsis rhizosphaerae TaxID=2053003 RepID=UPI001C95DA3B|nr:methyltransferase domain-containing protein [Amycolatopsis rhizosphaerae]